MYYIFKIIDENDIFKGFGFIPEDKIDEDVKENAYAILEDLPDIPTEIQNKPYELTEIVEGSKVFCWAIQK